MRALGPGSVSSFLKVILDVFYYVLWVTGVVIALAILALLLVSFDPQILPGHIYADLPIMGHATGAAAAALLTGFELYLIGLIVIVQRLRLLFSTMTAGDPFHPDNVRRLRVIALVLALLEIDRYLFGAFERFALHEPLHAASNVSLTGWFAVLVIVVLSEVFREGARLRRDAELTI